MAKTIIKKGNFEIREHESGRYTLIGPGLEKRGYNQPSDEQIRERYLKEMSHRISQSTLVWLGYRGFMAKLKEPGEPPSKLIRNSALGRKVLGLPDPITKTKNGLTFFVKENEIHDAIRACWTQIDYEKAMRGDDAPLHNLRYFAKNHYRAYKRLRTIGHGKSVKDMLKNEIEKIYPGLYAKITDEIDITKLSDRISERLLAGEELSKSGLEKSSDARDRDIFNRIIRVKNNNLVGTGLTFGKVVAKLANIDGNLMAGMHDKARIAEKITQLYCIWGQIAGNPLDIPNLHEYSKDDLLFNYGDVKNGRADGRLGNIAIEVKSRDRSINGYILEDILKKYSANKGSWVLGPEIEGAMLFLHMEERLTMENKKRVNDAGIRVIEPDEFKKGIIEVFERMNNRQYKMKELEPVPDLEAFNLGRSNVFPLYVNNVIFGGNIFSAVTPKMASSSRGFLAKYVSTPNVPFTLAIDIVLIISSLYLPQVSISRNARSLVNFIPRLG